MSFKGKYNCTFHCFTCRENVKSIAREYYKDGFYALCPNCLTLNKITLDKDAPNVDPYIPPHEPSFDYNHHPG